MKFLRLLTVFIVSLSLILILQWGLSKRTILVLHAAGPINVNSAIDANDVNLGDNLCDDGTGKCTLRAAVQEANVSSNIDTITLVTGTYALTLVGDNENAGLTGDLDITSDLTISGIGPEATIIDASALSDRVLHIITGTVVISGITIQGGASMTEGGGIWNERNLTLINVSVISNTSISGGGIANFSLLGETATVLMTNTVVHYNIATTANGGGITNSDRSQLSIYGSSVNYNAAQSQEGGGIASTGVVTIVNSSVSTNTASGAGGISINGGFATILNTIISSNVATETSGGIFNAGTMHIANSTISLNTSGSDGGGIYNFDLLELLNSTVSYNTATGNTFGTEGYLSNHRLSTV